MILCVAGARPNFMKIAPLLAELDRRGLASHLVHTGQHYDAKMSDVFFEELGIRRPDSALGVGSGSHAVQTARVMEAFEPVVEAVRPDWVVVVGDVNSTVACSLVAAKLGVDVAHVEAGLRSRDWAMPEEINRVVTDRLSRLLLAPSTDGVDNLRAEGYPTERIALVGNVMIDTLMANRERAMQRGIVDELGLRRQEFALLTLHRPSNVDDDLTLGGLLDALGTISADLPIVWPVHPRVAARAERLVGDTPIRLIEPRGYLDFIALEEAARLVLTDSGGVQEETTALGVACLTLRESTERPITVTEGTNRVVGVDPGAIIEAARDELATPTPARRPDLWDGRASARIVDAMAAADRNAPMT